MAQPRPQGLGRRLGAAWRALSREQRRAAYASFGLFVSMFLPWYDKSLPGRKQFRHDNLTAFGAFSFVEAAVLLVSAGVLAMLFARGEGRAFHLPGGDGTIIMVAGAWTAILIVWRLFDKPGVSGGVTIGLQWGIFVALIITGILAWTGAAAAPAPPRARARRAGRGPHTGRAPTPGGHPGAARPRARSVLEQRVAVGPALVGQAGDRVHAVVVVSLDLVQLDVHPAGGAGAEGVGDEALLA
jgi:hypothetical protein